MRCVVDSLGVVNLVNWDSLVKNVVLMCLLVDYWLDSLVDL